MIVLQEVVCFFYHISIYFLGWFALFFDVIAVLSGF